MDGSPGRIALTKEDETGLRTACRLILTKSITPFKSRQLGLPTWHKPSRDAAATRELASTASGGTATRYVCTRDADVEVIPPNFAPIRRRDSISELDIASFTNSPP
jgi:hypothetical protein